MMLFSPLILDGPVLASKSLSKWKYLESRQIYLKYKCYLIYDFNKPNMIVRLFLDTFLLIKYISYLFILLFVYFILY